MDLGRPLEPMEPPDTHPSRTAVRVRAKPMQQIMGFSVDSDESAHVWRDRVPSSPTSPSFLESPNSMPVGDSQYAYVHSAHEMRAHRKDFGEAVEQLMHDAQRVLSASLAHSDQSFADRVGARVKAAIRKSFTDRCDVSDRQLRLVVSRKSGPVAFIHLLLAHEATGHAPLVPVDRCEHVVSCAAQVFVVDPLSRAGRIIAGKTNLVTHPKYVVDLLLHAHVQRWHVCASSADLRTSMSSVTDVAGNIPEDGSPVHMQAVPALAQGSMDKEALGWGRRSGLRQAGGGTTGQQVAAPSPGGPLWLNGAQAQALAPGPAQAAVP